VQKHYDYYWFDVPEIFRNQQESQDFMINLNGNKIDVFAHQSI
jgi:uncharacterized protein YcfL